MMEAHAEGETGIGGVITRIRGFHGQCAYVQAYYKKYNLREVGLCTSKTKESE